MQASCSGFRSSPIACRRASAGFTLVELLIAITLIGLLTVLLFGGMRFATRAVAISDAAVERSSQLSVAYGFLQRVLANAQPLPQGPGTDTEDAPIVFDGAKDRLEFATLPPAYLATGGFTRLTLSLVQDGRGAYRLVAGWQPIARGPTSAELRTLPPSVLLERVATIAFAYFGQPTPDQPPNWFESWDAMQGLPALVRLRVEFADGSMAPELLVAPRAADAVRPMQTTPIYRGGRE